MRAGGWVEPEVIADVRAALLDDAAPVTAASVAAAVRRTGRVLGASAQLDLVSRLSAELAGAGPLQPLLDDPRTTDVFVNGSREVWVDRGEGLRRSRVSLGAEADVRALAVRLAAAQGKRLDDATPLVDVRLPGGVRLNAIIPPISGETTLLSLRVPRLGGFSLGSLVAGGFVPAAWHGLLHGLMVGRVNFLVSGGTGAGKTALLGALLATVPGDERIVIVEDAKELVVEHPHVVSLAARQRNIEGAGEITMTDLVRNALRMRPDRLVVGECRGAEVRDMFAALNTGHEGACATLHANTAADVPARLEALGALAGMTGAAVAAQSASAVDAIVHVRRDGALRGVAEIATMDRAVDGRLEVRTALWRERLDPASPLLEGEGAAGLRAILAAKGVSV